MAGQYVALIRRSCSEILNDVHADGTRATTGRDIVFDASDELTKLYAFT